MSEQLKTAAEGHRWMLEQCLDTDKITFIQVKDPQPDEAEWHYGAVMRVGSCINTTLRHGAYDDMDKPPAIAVALLVIQRLTRVVLHTV